MSERRFTVERSVERLGAWDVIDTEGGSVRASYSLRTNWIDGRHGMPYGPQAAAEEIARRLNAGEPVPSPEYEADREDQRREFARVAPMIAAAERGDLHPGPERGYGLWQIT